MPEQSTPFRTALLTLAGAGIAFAGTAWAQAYTPPPPPLTTAPCVPTKKDPCTAPNTTPPPAPAEDKFAFPGDSSSSPDDANSKPTPPNGSPSQTAIKPSSKPNPNDHSFPFPGETLDPSPSSSSSSSSSSSAPDAPKSDDPSNPSPPLKDAGSSGSTPSSRRHKLAKVEDLSEREVKDIDVSRFYLSTGNFLGAYNRAKDATRLYPDDPEAHFALAAAAQKLKKNDEATAEYKSYLKLEPDGDHVKVAQHALTEIH